MSSNKLVKRAVLILTVLFGLSTAGVAQSSSKEQLGRLSQRLQLDEKQKTELAPLVEQEFRQFKALRENSSMGKLQKLRKATQIQADFRNQAARYLSPKQQKELEQMQAERREEFRGAGR